MSVWTIPSLPHHHCQPAQIIGQNDWPMMCIISYSNVQETVSHQPRKMRTVRFIDASRRKIRYNTSLFTVPYNRMGRRNTSCAFLLVLLVASVSLSVASQSLSSCSISTSCNSCTSHSILRCRWCPMDNTCHDPGAIVTNKCSTAENIVNPVYCNCTHAPGPGISPASACPWYQTRTGSADPKDWAGADFLPVPYQVAATCACQGGGNKLWTTPVANCVRLQIIQQHQDLPDAIKQAIKSTTIPLPVDDPNIDALYSIHVNAYKICGCTGSPAPLITWYGVFWLGNLPVCDDGTNIAGINYWVLQAGRCGCGW